MIRHTQNSAFQRPTQAQPSAPEAARARDAVRRDSEYRLTPLLARPHAAAKLGLGNVMLKDEGARLADQGLSSFKAVGVMAAMAALRADPGAFGDPHTLVCASDGNYGRAVAWAAARAGLSARIYLPSSVSTARFAAIARFSAQTVAVDGTYDTAVAAAATAGQAPGILEFSDTGRHPNDSIPRLIETGYGVIVRECLEAWPSDLPPPSHLFVPVGVGGLAVGLATAFADELGPAMPDIVTVEPYGADSLRHSLATQRLRTLAPPDDAAELMGCLACETPSATAWQDLTRLTRHALAIDDATATAAMAALADGPDAPALLAGDSGAAAYGGLLAACAEPALRGCLGLDHTSRVLVMVSEGATDPALQNALRAMGR
jgi:diaminopropionate ammonia-lyase